VTITSGVFAQVYSGIHPWVHVNALSITIPWVTDAGTAGELLVKDFVVGGASTDAWE
jgi:hypothetical protein